MVVRSGVLVGARRAEMKMGASGLRVDGSAMLVGEAQ